MIISEVQNKKRASVHNYFGRVMPELGRLGLFAVIGCCRTKDASRFGVRWSLNCQRNLLNLCIFLLSWKLY